MNITLSARAELIRRAREYAAEHDTSLNQLIRDYLERLVGELPLPEAAREFAVIATASPGNSEGAGVPRREDIYAERMDGMGRAAQVAEAPSRPEDE